MSGHPQAAGPGALSSAAEHLLRVEQLDVRYPVIGGIMLRQQAEGHAVEDRSLAIRAGGRRGPPSPQPPQAAALPQRPADDLPGSLQLAESAFDRWPNSGRAVIP